MERGKIGRKEGSKIWKKGGRIKGGKRLQVKIEKKMDGKRENKQERGKISRRGISKTWRKEGG